jgi:hypothetical protein
LITQKKPGFLIKVLPLMCWSYQRPSKPDLNIINQSFKKWPNVTRKKIQNPSPEIGFRV